MRQALEMALEFIERVNKNGWILADFETQMYEAITAIKEALAQPEQAPVAWLHTKIEGVAVPHRPADLDKHPDRWTPLYTTPPQRTWVGLTDEEIYEAVKDREGSSWRVIVDAIEAKLKEKNT